METVRTSGPPFLSLRRLPGRRLTAADETLREVLRAVLTAPRLDGAVFSPGLLAKVPLDRLQLMVDQLRERHGAVRSVQPHQGLWRVHCAHGTELLWARLDGHGHLTALVLGPAALTARHTAPPDTPAPPPSTPEPPQTQQHPDPCPAPPAGPSAVARRATARRYAAAAAATATAAVLQPLLAALSPTATDWLLAAVTAPAVAWYALRTGPWHALPPYARLLPSLAATATLLAGVRIPLAPLPWSPPTPAAAVAALAALAAIARTARRARPLPDPGGPPPLVLASPLRGGRFCLVQGGGPALNRHAADAYARATRHACDLTALGSGPRWRGRRALGLMPASNNRYALYGHPVLSPCDGTVVAVLDGLPDNEPGAVDPANPLGNHIAVETAQALVVLGHLRCGSILVSPGTKVTTGTPLAAAGNSGDTGGEPLLHLRAETRGSAASPGWGTAVPLRLAELPGAPRRGRRYTA